MFFPEQVWLDSRKMREFVEDYLVLKDTTLLMEYLANSPVEGFW